MASATGNLADAGGARTLSRGECYLIVVCVFLGWYFSGVQMSIGSLAMHPAAVDLLRRWSVSGQSPGQWFAWYTCAFLFGAAAGGYVFGWVGDRYGRARAMGLSICCSAAFSGIAYFAADPVQLLVLRFLACLGIGGMWPNGVSLASEAWPNMSRPMLAGVIGMAANIGLVTLALIAQYDQFKITPDHWRWTMLVGAAPLVLGIFSLAFVPESPRWLAQQRQEATASATTSTGELWRPPLLRVTLVGIALGTVPVVGGWGSTNWMIPWAEEVQKSHSHDGTAGSTASPPVKADPHLKARIQTARSAAGTVASLLGGWFAILAGRRLSYFLASLAALASAQYLFRTLTPLDDWFLFWVSAVGFFHGLYMGWLPLCLPEFFPTHVRSTGSGVSFNFGRVISAVIVLLTGLSILRFAENYARIGQITSLIFAVGMVAILLAPDTSQKQLQD